MAGKAVAVAKAAKKPAVVAKAVVKKPVAKAKPAAVKAKPATKKPVVAKFNLNKLMMLIVRDAPKKGKKMMGGGYTNDSIKPIKVLIHKFIKDNYDRVFSSANMVGFNKVNDSNRDYAHIKSIIQHIGGDGNHSILFDNTLYNSYSPNEKDKYTYDMNFNLIVQTLCKVYVSFIEHAEGGEASDLV